MKQLTNLLVALALVSPTLHESVFAQPRFEIPLTVTDTAVHFTSYFGVLPGGNFCIVPQDSINGHWESFLPPVPPGVFDAHFVWPRAGTNGACFDLGSFADYRPFNSYVQRDTFRVNVLYPNVLPVTVSWPSGLSTYFRKLVLKDVATNGATYNIDMLTTTSVAIDLDPAHVKIYASGPRTPDDLIEVQVRFQNGWNLISNPVKNAIPGDSVRQLLPFSLNPFVFGYEGGYVQQYRVVHGKGYWCKFPGATTVTFRGTGYANDTISVVGGWGMIGTAFYPVPIDSVFTIPPGIIASKFFGLESGYTMGDTLWPGKGYYVKVRQPGLLILPGGF